MVEHIDANLWYRWFVGLGIDDEVWNHSTYSKNRDRLLEHDVAKIFFEEVLNLAREHKLLSDEHFTVDGTLIESMASLKSFKPKNKNPKPPKGKNDDVNFRGEQRKNDTHQQNDTNRKSSIDSRTTRHAGYETSLRKRKLVEEIFGWMKTIGGIKRLRHKGLQMADWTFTFTTAAYNLVRMIKLLPA